jgi:hypothetical protein
MGLFTDIKNKINPNTVEDIKASINKHGGVARSNRFNVIITPPTQTLLNLDLESLASSALSGNFGLGSLINDPREFSILCESCSFPGRQVTTLDYTTFRNSRKIPYAYANEDITFSFHLTTDYYMKKVWERWHQSIIDPETYLIEYDDKYQSDIIIQQLDRNNLPVYGVLLKNAYPVGINSIELSNGTENEGEKLSVTVTYEDFEPQGAISTMVSGVRNTITSSLRRII